MARDITLEFLKKNSAFMESVKKISSIYESVSKVTQVFENTSRFTKVFNQAPKLYAGKNEFLSFQVGKNNQINKVLFGTENYIDFGGLKVQESWTFKNKVQELDFVRTIIESQNRMEKELHTQLKEKISRRLQYEMINGREPFSVDEFSVFSSEKMGAHLSGLADYLRLDDFASRSLHLDVVLHEYLHDLSLVSVSEERIKENSKQISLLKHAKALLSSCFKRFQINKRDFFRKMNSFFFKNLDDCDSVALLSIRY